MPERILIEEFHLDCFIPRNLPDTETRAIRRTLDSRRFQDRVKRAIRAVLRTHHSLKGVRIALTR